MALDKIMFGRVEGWAVGLCGLSALVLGALWGIGASRWGWFPGPAVGELRAVIVGVSTDDRDLMLRMNTLTFAPFRYPGEAESTFLPLADLSPMRLAPDAAGDVPRIDGNLTYRAPGSTDHYLVYGSFWFAEQKANWGTILIDDQGQLARGWAFEPDSYDFHGGHIGLALAPDGTVATNAHGVLMAKSWCGAPLWQADRPRPTDGPPRPHDAVDGHDWHHDISVGGGRFWTFRGTTIMGVDISTGAIIDEIPVTDVMAWGRRQGLHLLDSRRRDVEAITQTNLAERFIFDPFHFNKVDYLEEDEAAAHPDFEVGDLLISARELNLVFVIRPAEERIVWWRYGLTMRQHDPTFTDQGIEVFDNNVGAEPPRPRLVRLDPDHQTAEELFDFSQWDMDMPWAGNFERTGNRLLTVDTKGRVLSGTMDGQLDFVFENRLKRSDRYQWLTLRDASRLDVETVEQLNAQCTNERTTG
ncbi:hypothetical protein PB2503_05452 [Parvularcula bermudensis HTCC2503]|uniref:Arylsulfotransferase ASST n=1 Tax=Parvularcula bermudensis (strain ATCC BAA-594 / HTCC2503 / KCTC 12087) TaxID=314260 RepID=E0TGC1_PARBH|nr:arylsulfotransferase family protein [Parvularcula bermudensis]ADM09164.1 hypothetical protein PB2503_05452 [Parvularcula bermudensis HTCC2503]